MSTVSIQVGDVVRLGPTAREKHYVLRIFWDGRTVRVRQSSTGVERNVAATRCVVVADRGGAA